MDDTLKQGIIVFIIIVWGDSLFMNERTLRIKSKIWVELDDQVVFGLGRIRLFEAIEKTGSLNQAASLLGMSYRAAWGKVTATEERLKLQLVERNQGKRNSGTVLTPTGKELLFRYKQFQEEAQQKVDESFEEHLGEILKHLKQYSEGEAID